MEKTIIDGNKPLWWKEGDVADCNLTVRGYMATSILTGLVSGDQISEEGLTWAISKAVSLADGLIEQLNA